MKKILISFALLGLIGANAFAQTAEVVGNAEAAKKKNAMCIGCHGIEGYRATFPTQFKVPMIAGQSEKYIENALKAYRSGERLNPSMRGVAGSLTDQDIADLAKYYAQAGAASNNAPKPAAK